MIEAENEARRIWQQKDGSPPSLQGGCAVQRWDGDAAVSTSKATL